MTFSNLKKREENQRRLHSPYDDTNEEKATITGDQERVHPGAGGSNMVQYVHENAEQAGFHRFSQPHEEYCTEDNQLSAGNSETTF